MTKITDAELIERGLAVSSFVLDLNHSLTVPPDMELSAPWNLPSRLFRFPIEIGEVAKDGSRSVGLMHPLLGDHPFVLRAEAELGARLSREGGPNTNGVTAQGSGRWWHAVDLVSTRHWRELIETRRFTTDDAIAGAVVYGLDYSPRDGERTGHITTEEARELMRALGVVEPADRAVALLALAAPKPTQPEKGAQRWPINSGGGMSAAEKAWGRILGIEAVVRL